MDQSGLHTTYGRPSVFRPRFPHGLVMIQWLAGLGNCSPEVTGSHHALLCGSNESPSKRQRKRKRTQIRILAKDICLFHLRLFRVYSFADVVYSSIMQRVWLNHVLCILRFYTLVNVQCLQAIYPFCCLGSCCDFVSWYSMYSFPLCHFARLEPWRTTFTSLLEIKHGQPKPVLAYQRISQGSTEPPQLVIQPSTSDPARPPRPIQNEISNFRHHMLCDFR